MIEMNTEPTPVDLNIDGNGNLVIRWSDQFVQTLPIRYLRDRCPCATCLEKKMEPPAPSTSLPIVSAAEAQPLRIVSMQPSGNYAYRIEFSDSHGSGVYTLEYIRTLSP